MRLGAPVALLLLVAGCLSSGPKAPPPQPVAAGADSGTAVMEYRLQPGDVLDVKVFSRTGTTPIYQDPTLAVDIGGGVTLPVAGNVHVESMTLDDCRAALLKAFSSEYTQPVVSVKFAQGSGAKVHILGEVMNPGSYALTARTTSLEAVLMAGGFSPDADKQSVVIMRPGKEAQDGSQKIDSVSLDFALLLKNADRLPIVDMHPGDIVYVPPIGIARSGRFHNHLAAVMSPYSTLLRAVGDVILWNQVTD